MINDFLIEDVNVPETHDGMEKDIEAEVHQPLKEGPSEDSVESSNTQTSDTVAAANLNLCFFVIKKRNKIGLRMSHYELQKKINLKKSELYQQLLRAHYISSLWRNAHKKQLTNLDPLEYGWIEQHNTYAFKWFEGNQLPSFVSDLITNVPESDSIDDEDESSNDEHDSDDEDDE
ncbi:hypothetical protein JTB14_010063 [Gonioctena quinquepunctata]|nr:hypothetical protein JTB14_010063 [Gonioctena quinquepunctata]